MLTTVIALLSIVTVQSRISLDDDPKTLPIQGTATYQSGGNSLLLSILIKGIGTGNANGNGGGSGIVEGGAKPSATVAPSGGTTPGNDPNFSDEQNAALRVHNRFRQIHSAPAMKLNKEMCDDATAYAKVIAEMGELKHSSKKERNGDGENLSMGCSSEKSQSTEEATTNWYNEVCDPGYTFGVGSSVSSGTGHFTQVVWETSTELGIGRAEAIIKGMKCAFIVGRYRKAGNMMGSFETNVKIGSFDKNSYCSNLENVAKKASIEKTL